MGATPHLRSGPPWAMEEMVRAEPELARSILGATDGAPRVADRIRAAVEREQPVAVVGCGTSEHAAMAIAELLRPALGRLVSARQAFEASLDPWPGLCLAISHEGGTAATLAALRAGADAGAETALITAESGSDGAQLADEVLVTPLVDRSWCHTVGYLSPILAGGAIAAALARTPVDAVAVAGRLGWLLEARKGARHVARDLSAASRFIVVGSGVDIVAARELALKIEEGAWRPAVGRDTETQLHGHLASADEDAALVAFVVDPRDVQRRAARAAQLLRAARRIGMATAAVVSAEANGLVPADATSASRLVLPEPATGVDPLFAAVLDGAMLLQQLALGLVDAYGTNPDLIRRHDEAYREAAALAESA